jgi:hypothetical protein
VPVTIIADRLGCHQLSIKRLLTKAKSLPPRSIPARKKGSGRPAGNIKENVPEVAAVSLRHIRRHLVEKLRLQSRIAAHKPLLTRQKKAKRLAFAKNTGT